MVPDMDVNYLYVSVGYVDRALVLQIRLSWASIRIEMRYVAWCMQKLSVGKILYKQFGLGQRLGLWRQNFGNHEQMRN